MSRGPAGLTGAFNAPCAAVCGLSSRANLNSRDTCPRSDSAGEILAKDSLDSACQLRFESDPLAPIGPGPLVGETTLCSVGLENDSSGVMADNLVRAEDFQVESKRLAKLWLNNVARDISNVKSQLSFSDSDGGGGMDFGFAIKSKELLDESILEKTKKRASISDSDEYEDSDSEESEQDSEDEIGGEDEMETAYLRCPASSMQSHLEAAQESEEIVALLKLGEELGLGVASRKEDVVDMLSQIREDQHLPKRTLKKSRNPRQVSPDGGETSVSVEF